MGEWCTPSVRSAFETVFNARGSVVPDEERRDMLGDGSKVVMYSQTPLRQMYAIRYQKLLGPFIAPPVAARRSDHVSTQVCAYLVR